MTREEALALRPGDVIMWRGFGNLADFCIVKTRGRVVTHAGDGGSWWAHFAGFWAGAGSLENDYDPSRLRVIG